MACIILAAFAGWMVGRMSKPAPQVTSASSTASLAAEATATPEAENPASLSAYPTMIVATGKWKPFSDKKGDQLAYPNHVVEIDCFKSDNQCLEAQAAIGFGGRPKLDLTYYEIEKWDEHGITASNSSSICNVNQISISFESQVVTVMDMPKKVQADTCKQFLGANRKPEPYRLVREY
jgi:hypothetical protein